MHTTKSKITYSPLISVIIPTYNRKAMCLSAVESVLAQLEVDVEIIVVDDGSSDGTKEYLTHVFEKITYIFQSNQDVSIARNNGLNVAKGEPSLTLTTSSQRRLYMTRLMS
ncbi:MAG: glycosyltransferase involved in cell wall biosynthesis [Francisellaceae bacterium]|jgi:glycosyltransferase involved in cell wall biosynthesis